jgi:hypothetical protein
LLTFHSYLQELAGVRVSLTLTLTPTLTLTLALQELEWVREYAYELRPKDIDTAGYFLNFHEGQVRVRVRVRVSVHRSMRLGG